MEATTFNCDDVEDPTIELGVAPTPCLFLLKLMRPVSLPVLVQIQSLFKGCVSASTIELGGGSDLFSVSGIRRNDSVVAAGAGIDTVLVGEAIMKLDCTLGGNQDLLIASAVSGNTTINGGAGSDTIVISGGCRFVPDLW